MSGHREDQPLVSIILCTYNRARLLRRAIRSVLAQRYATWELIVVDDGSTDRTARLLAEFARRDNRIRPVHQPNRGPARARNAGMKLAFGEYVCFLDSDDEFTPTHIGARVKAMKLRPRIDMLYGGLVVRGPLRKRYVADLERPGRLIHVKECYVGGTFFLRRRVVSQGFRFRTMKIGEDLDFVTRVAKTLRVARIDSPRTYVYHCEGSDRLCEVFTVRRRGAGGRGKRKRLKSAVA